MDPAIPIDLQYDTRPSPWYRRRMTRRILYSVIALVVVLIAWDRLPGVLDRVSYLRLQARLAEARPRPDLVMVSTAATTNTSPELDGLSEEFFAKRRRY